MIKYKPIFKHIYRTQMIRANACMPYGRFIYYEEDGTAKTVLHPAELRKPFGRFIEINLNNRGKRRYNPDQKYSLNNMSDTTIHSLRNKQNNVTRSVPEAQPQIDTEPILSAQPTGSLIERLMGMGQPVRQRRNMPAAVPPPVDRFDASQTYADRAPVAVVNLDNSPELDDVESMETQTTDTRPVVHPLLYADGASGAKNLEMYIKNVINYRSYRDNMNGLYEERRKLWLDDSLENVRWFTNIDPVVFRNLAYALIFSPIVPKEELVKFINSTTEIATLDPTDLSPQYERYLLLVFVSLLNDEVLLKYATEQSPIKTITDMTAIRSMPAYIKRLNEFEILTSRKTYHVPDLNYIPRRGFLEVRIRDPELRVITLFTNDYRELRYVPPSNITKHSLTFTSTATDDVLGAPDNDWIESYKQLMRTKVQV